MSSNPYTSFVLGAICGGAFAFISTAYILSFRDSKKAKNGNLGDDDCLSLFYHNHTPSNGSGVNFGNPCDMNEIKGLQYVHPEYKKLPIDFYSKAVESLPILCVDVMCRRKSDGKFLLFLRRDKPAANIWWWPGGRMFRGETFFQAAVRKISDETGSDARCHRPVSVVQVWNTFFPDSSWDNERLPGREGTQTVNVVIMTEFDGSDVENKNDSKDQWAVTSHRWVSPEEALIVGCFDKYVYLNMQLAKQNLLLG